MLKLQTKSISIDICEMNSGNLWTFALLSESDIVEVYGSIHK